MTDWHAYGIRGTLPFYAQLYPCIALITRGKLLDWWIHKHYKAFNVVTKIHYPENPRTAFQQAWRDYMYFGVKNWQGFTDETKRYYNQRAKPIGDYGYHRYLSLYLHANYPPVVSVGDLLLLETGDKILQENGSRIMLEYYYLLTEAGEILLLENGGKIKG